MNKLTKIKYLVPIGLGLLLFAGSVQAASLEVEFETGDGVPLFNEANFLPGDSVTRWVKVTNNAGETKSVATEAIYTNDPDGLGEMLNIEVKEGTTVLYSDTLANFFGAGEVYLSDLADGVQTQYDFTISFLSSAENDYQGKTLGFDILVGLQGEVAVSGGGSSGGGSSGSPGLAIFNEEFVQAESDTVIVSWHTNHKASSRVIYSRDDEPHTFDWSDHSGPFPLYGYAHTSDEYHVPPVLNGVTYREITLTGLTPGHTYYFRCISHASPDTISEEHTFTLAMAEESGGEGESGEGEEGGSSGGTSGGTGGSTGGGEEGSSGEGTGGEGEEGGESGEGEESGGEEGSGYMSVADAGERNHEVLSEEEQPSRFSNLLAGLATLIVNPAIWLIIFAIFLFLLFLITRRKKKKEEKQQGE